MNTKMNGKKVDSVVFSNGDTIRSQDGNNLVLSATHHGDHDEFWVIATDEGEERARHNCRHIESIQWAEEKNDNP